MIEALYVEGLRGPKWSSSWRLLVLSGQPGLPRSVVREVEGTGPRVSKARKAGKSRLKEAGNTT